MTATAGALSCVMMRMVAAYSIGKKTTEETRKQIEAFQVRFQRADQVMRGLIAEDAAAFENLQSAARESRANSSAESARQAAVLMAISVPLEMAATAAEAMDMMDRFKALAGKYIISDLGVAAVLADATARAAKFSVLINVNELAELAARNSALDQIDRIIKRCGQSYASIQAFVNQRIRDLSGDVPGG